MGHTETPTVFRTQCSNQEFPGVEPQADERD